MKLDLIRPVFYIYSWTTKQKHNCNKDKDKQNNIPMLARSKNEHRYITANSGISLLSIFHRTFLISSEFWLNANASGSEVSIESLNSTEYRTVPSLLLILLMLSPFWEDVSEDGMWGSFSVNILGRSIEICKLFGEEWKWEMGLIVVDRLLWMLKG